MKKPSFISDVVHAFREKAREAEKARSPHTNADARHLTSLIWSEAAVYLENYLPPEEREDTLPPAIRTSYHPTLSSPQILAVALPKGMNPIDQAKRPSVYLQYNSSLTLEENHSLAAAALMIRLNWDGPLSSGFYGQDAFHIPQRSCRSVRRALKEKSPKKLLGRQ
jgi:hypothetical protein